MNGLALLNKMDIFARLISFGPNFFIIAHIVSVVSVDESPTHILFSDI